MSIYFYDPSALHKRFKRIIRANETPKQPNLDIYFYDPSALHKRFKRILRAHGEVSEDGKPNKKKVSSASSKNNNYPYIQSSSQPVVDIFETESALIIQAELPGIQKSDISLDVQNGLLMLECERVFVHDEETEKLHRVERVYGKIQRSFTLPSNVDVESITATFNSGVLELTIPKPNQPTSQRIAIQ